MKPILLTLALCAALTAQTPVKPADLCTVEGRVVNAVTGKPLRDVKLKLRPPREGDSVQVVFTTSTDEAGNFAFAGIEPGAYRFSAERIGFVTANFGARRSSAAPVPLVLQAAQKTTGLEFKLKPQAVIAGRVVNRDEVDADVVMVQAAKVMYQQGRRQVSTVQTPGGGTLDDLGEYRLAGLEAGLYYVVAAPFAMAGPVPATLSAKPVDLAQRTYHYSATDAGNAEVLDMTAGVTRTGVDVALVSSPAFPARARIVNQSGEDLVQLTVTLMPLGGARTGLAMAITRSNPQGQYDLGTLAPGTYPLAATGVNAKGQALAARQTLVVNGPGESVDLVLKAGVPVSGHLQMEDGSVPAGLSVTVAMQTPVSSDTRLTRASRVAKDGAFPLTDVSPERYFAKVVGLTEGAYVKSIRLGEADVLENGADLTSAPAGPLEIVLSPKGGSISGAVTEAQDAAAAGVVVALIPQNAKHRERAEWYRTATTDAEGKFSLTGIPPGEYKLFAWDDVDDNAWMDPEFIKPIEPKGKPITIAEDISQKVTLVVIVNP